MISLSSRSIFSDDWKMMSLAFWNCDVPNSISHYFFARYDAPAFNCITIFDSVENIARFSYSFLRKSIFEVVWTFHPLPIFLITSFLIGVNRLNCGICRLKRSFNQWFITVRWPTAIKIIRCIKLFVCDINGTTYNRHNTRNDSLNW